MGVRRPGRLKRWSAALGFSLAVHVVLLGVMLNRKADPPRVERPSIEVVMQRPSAPPKPEPRPEKRPTPLPQSAVVKARPVEAPPAIPTSGIPAARTPRPPEPAAPSVATAPPPPRPLRLGCEGQDFTQMTPKQRGDCMRDLTSFARASRPGEAEIPANAREMELAAESAAKEKRNQRMRPSGDAKHFGCKEASLGVGCTDDRMVPIWKQPF